MANFGQIRLAIFSDCFLAYFLPFRFLAQNDSMVKSLEIYFGQSLCHIASPITKFCIVSLQKPYLDD